ncbi:MAG: RNA methyltransferase [Magnetococcales bacterium]|nr:RNA methyltransferase [Magnetococcales bacterium]MBF0156957.1 RNA methyltransferase [Magnetococcales bacterium]
MEEAAFFGPVVILDRPAHAGNIGSVARAMKNMGIKGLRLVRPRQFPHPEAVDFAVGAVDILETVELFSTLPEAVADLNFLVATTNRYRGQRHEVVTPRQLGERMEGLRARPATRMGILFGTERSGLETRDLDRADLILNIPTDGDYGSLNLSQAVLLVAYELMLAEGRGKGIAFDPTGAGPLAGTEDLERFFEQLESVLREIDFLKPKQSRHMMGSLRAIFHRAALDRREVAILRGIFSEVIASRGRLVASLMRSASGEVGPG